MGGGVMEGGAGVYKKEKKSMGSATRCSGDPPPPEYPPAIMEPLS